MSPVQNKKIRKLLFDKKVMTIGCCNKGMPWSSPVYFVWYDNLFAFFSNPDSRHIRYSADQTASASIFNDGEKISDIYGLQMSGRISKISSTALKLCGIKKYIQKFSFIQKEFGNRILTDSKFLLEKFNAGFYGFFPERVLFSDNLTAAEKQVPVDLDLLKTSDH